MNLIASINNIDRQIKGVLRGVNTDEFSREEKDLVSKIKLACNEIKLDIRDYEYAQTREEQLKWAKLGRHNLHALEAILIKLPEVFGPADVAELSAKIETVKSELK